MKMWVRITNIHNGNYEEVQADSITWRNNQIIIKTEDSEITLNKEFYGVTLYPPNS